MEFSVYFPNNFMLRAWLGLFVSTAIVAPHLLRADDGEALLGLKSAVDPGNKLKWGRGEDLCKWEGVKQCNVRGRVIKLVVERMNLTGRLDASILDHLDQLRVLSFKGNSLSGQIPDLSGLPNLKSLFLNGNHFSGDFPSSLSSLHRLKVVVLSGNQISGHIPDSLLNLRRLYVLYLQDNRLTGPIPALNQTGLRYFNVSNNQLSSAIPVTPALARFNASSFSGNPGLCGQQIGVQCNGGPGFPPALSPAYSTIPETKPTGSRREKRRHKLTKILAGSIGGFLALLIVVALLVLLGCCITKRSGGSKKNKKSTQVKAGGDDGGGREAGESREGRDVGGKFTWEEPGEGLGTLVFVGPGEQQMSYSLEDLLKASAETLGRGSVGSTYKAVMESGYIVTVKRLKEARYPRLEEFRRQMDVLGRLRHPNLVPLRAYFQAKEERLLVYDYFPNGSLFSLIHGSRGSGSGKPLHWTSCLKIAEDLATGLLYIHQNPGLAHGNLKSSNVLLGSDFESCLTDYGLTAFRNPELLEESSAYSLFYRAPECRDARKPPTQQADIYGFGVLLLELLTGKTPFQDLVQEHGSDIPAWVRSVREEETESGEDPASSNEASEEKLGSLLNIAMACVSLSPDNRPVMREVLRMIREARAEAQNSSNSSDHSPGRWSDTVQSLPRQEQLNI